MARGRDFLGGYRLVRLIRAGQTCQVWEGISDVDGSRVALKALQPEQRDNKEEIAYLKHEFEVGKSFKHENVIEIYAFSTDRSVPFLVLEFNSGRNMKLVIREDAEALHPIADQVVLQCARGLHYVHSQGWVHRDIKPDNFLVDGDGQIKLIDFAIATRLKSGWGKLFANRFRNIQGTRSYMSPEQIRGQSLDERADIYSFGCLLFELVAGKLPYTASSPTELLEKHLRATIPTAATFNSRITPDFNQLIMRMMSKTADKRPRDMNEVLRVLAGIKVFKTRVVRKTRPADPTTSPSEASPSESEQ